MSLRPQPIGPIPEETARVTKAAFPGGNLSMRIRHTCPLKPRSPLIALLRGLTLGLPHALLALRRGIGSTRHDGT
jgi:hypothetical protein